jgi:cytochrome c oxidase subunit 1
MVTVSSHQTISTYKKIFATTDHKMIGKLYLVFALLNFAIAGLLALIMRAELFSPGQQIIQDSDWGMLFTTHGLVMIFLAIFPLGAAFGNYMIPIMLKARDLYWPRWNNIAFWLLVPAALFMYLGLFTTPGVGWTMYPPLSTKTTSSNADLFIIGILIAGVSSVIGSINFILTVFYMRHPDITLKKIDLFSWATVFTSIIQILATPIITIGLVMLLVSRFIGAPFFDFDVLNGPILFQHVFWAYSHPAVYIMILPAMGLVSVLISKFSRNAVFGYTSMVVSMFVITFLGFVVWGHHLFTTGIIPSVALGFTSLTFVIAIPSGIKTFNWISTLYAGKIKLEVPMLFALAFIGGFALGGFSGVLVNVVVLDLVFQDTYFVVGHFHYVVIGGTVSAIFGTIYYLLPDMTGKMYNRKIANWHFITWTVGFILTFGAMIILGMLGMPRRYFDYSNLGNLDAMTILNQLATIGAILMAVAFLLFLYNVFWTVTKGPEAGDDPFGLGDTDMAPPTEHIVTEVS